MEAHARELEHALLRGTRQHEATAGKCWQAAAAAAGAGARAGAGALTRRSSQCFTMQAASTSSAHCLAQMRSWKLASCLTTTQGLGPFAATGDRLADQGYGLIALSSPSAPRPLSEAARTALSTLGLAVRVPLGLS